MPSAPPEQPFLRRLRVELEHAQLTPLKPQRSLALSLLLTLLLNRRRRAGSQKGLGVRSPSLVQREREKEKVLARRESLQRRLETLSHPLEKGSRESALPQKRRLQQTSLQAH